MPTLSDALALAGRGFAIIPATGKRPLTRHGVKDASADPAQITRWWTKWPDAGIGIATGSLSKLVVLDLDAGKGGLESLAELEKQHGTLPPTVRVKTGGGGRHYYFLCPAGAIGNRAGILPGVDFRGDGGYVIAAGSVHANGNRYELEADGELAAMPDWLLSLVRPEEKPASQPVVVKPDDFDGALSAMRKITTVDGNDGSKRLFTYACRCREFVLTAEQCIAAIRVIETERPFPKHWSDDEIRARWLQSAKTVDTGSAIDKPPSLWPAEGRTDAANAKRFVAKYGDRIRWVDAWGKWLIWNDRFWEEDGTCAIEMLAKRYASSLWVDIGEIIATGRTDDDLRRALSTFGKSSNSASGIANMLRLARSEPGIAIKPDQLDTGLFLLNVENGTIDLRTGKLEPHNRADLITRMIPAAYDPQAKCPQFIKFLDGVFGGNQNLISFVQRFTGHCLTGDVTEHALIIC